MTVNSLCPRYRENAGGVADRSLLVSTQLFRQCTANVCLYSMIRTGRKILDLQGVDRIIPILFPLKIALKFGVRRGDNKAGLHIKDSLGNKLKSADAQKPIKLGS